MDFVEPPPRPPWLLRLGLSLAQRQAAHPLRSIQRLAWYPRAAISSAVLEALVAHGDGRVTARTLQLVRIAVSAAVDCSFCMGMNTRDWERELTREELEAAQGARVLDEVETLTASERTAVEYARTLSATPAVLPTRLRVRLRAEFGEREIVILATTIAQVNYWSRLVQGLGGDDS